MKNITVSVDDELYHETRIEAARRRTSVTALVREFLVGMQKKKRASKEAIDPRLQKLWDLADSKPARRGSVGPLNREELYERGIPRH